MFHGTVVASYRSDTAAMIHFHPYPRIFLSKYLEYLYLQRLGHKQMLASNSLHATIKQPAIGYLMGMKSMSWHPDLNVHISSDIMPLS